MLRTRRPLARKQIFARGHSPRPPKCRRLCFEPLEDRSLLTVVGNGLVNTDAPASTLISNDTPATTIGHFELNVVDGGGASSSGVTAQGTSAFFANQNFIYSYLQYVEVGGDDGQVMALRDTTITQPAMLTAPNTVVSEGTFPGENGLVDWTATTTMAPGSPTATTLLTFKSATGSPLGSLQLINYLDEDVDSPNGDILHPTGTPGQNGFLAYTLDNVQRVGFAQGGVYQPGPGLVNATYVGWASDRFDELQTAITESGTTFTPAGNINLTNEPAFNDPQLGQVYGPNDITTAFAWQVDPTATTATITVLLQAQTTPASQPTPPTPPTTTSPTSVAVSNVSLPEGNAGTTPFTFTVTLPQASSTPVTLSYRTADGTATAADGDYIPTTSPVAITFPPGVTSMPITVLVNGDIVYENDETFFVSVLGSDGTIVGRGVGTILNDDAPPVLSISGATVVPLPTGSTQVTLTVTLTGATAAPAAVTYTTQNQSAIAGVDYLAATGGLSFGPGKTTQTVSFTILPERGGAAFDRDFQVVLSGALGATLANASATVVIAALVNVPISPITPSTVGPVPQPLPPLPLIGAALQSTPDVPASRLAATNFTFNFYGSGGSIVSPDAPLPNHDLAQTAIFLDGAPLPTELGHDVVLALALTIVPEAEGAEFSDERPDLQSVPLLASLDTALPEPLAPEEQVATESGSSWWLVSSSAAVLVGASAVLLAPRFLRGKKKWSQRWIRRPTSDQAS